MWFSKNKTPKVDKRDALIERYSKWSDLICHLYQHTNLEVPPTWLHFNDGDDYCAESRCCGFDNFETICLEFYYEEHDGVLQYTFHRHYRGTEKYEIIPLGNDIEKANIQLYVDEINKAFK